ncbi:MAG: hypothetical protein ABI585_10910 [Betaproteobacteria bacterium]
MNRWLPAVAAPLPPGALGADPREVVETLREGREIVAFRELASFERKSRTLAVRQVRGERPAP